MSESKLWASWSRFLDLWESTLGLRVYVGLLGLDFLSVEVGFGGSLLVSLAQKSQYFFNFSPSSNNKDILILNVP